MRKLNIYKREEKIRQIISYDLYIEFLANKISYDLYVENGSRGKEQGGVK